MNFRPPYDRQTRIAPKDGAVGVNPQGYLIECVNDLPELSAPLKLQISSDYLEIDGWLFPLAAVNKGFLVWFAKTLGRWAEESGTKEGVEWTDMIASTFEDALCEKFEGMFIFEWVGRG